METMGGKKCTVAHKEIYCSMIPWSNHNNKGDIHVHAVEMNGFAGVSSTFSRDDSCSLHAEKYQLVISFKHAKNTAIL